MKRIAISAVLFGVIVVLAGSTVTGQEKKAKGQLPPNYGKLGLSDEQKTKIYEIQAGYKAKVDELTKQIADLRAKQRKEYEAVLTAAQKDELRKLQTGETTEKKKPAEKK